MSFGNDTREKIAEGKRRGQHFVFLRGHHRDRVDVLRSGLELRVQAIIVDGARHDDRAAHAHLQKRNGCKNAPTRAQTVRCERNAGGLAEIGIDKRRDDFRSACIGHARFVGIIRTMRPGGIARPQQPDENGPASRPSSASQFGTRDALRAIHVEAVRGDQQMARFNIGLQFGQSESRVIRMSDPWFTATTVARLPPTGASRTSRKRVTHGLPCSQAASRSPPW